MCDLIDVVEDQALLIETKTFEVPSSSGEVRVWEDPSEMTLRALKTKFGELRGMTFPDGHYWVWQAYAATHEDVRKPNKVASVAHFYVGGDQPSDQGWTLGTWGLRAPGKDMTMWTDHKEMPPRLRSIFSGPASFAQFATPG